ncbi:hypothetical protein PFICI_06988 [Pestalotiopsis fici W106-1]|uniref:Beta-xylosidase C-terminal Concanavalin A-like domain-containing protein n=1 Tax=Pestalotiopsis fici (strain W106-1 / CGMCC3.15140) TaxID=1229662 RepID=W3X9Y7_PESFW|nr:uncharacterized protein PFICI_06988 [Pestalotiopsis fici W106-1]ETS81986.1 hypothetical protein PFICI_06988 [Pestalotiopsis fici W106-1]
MSTFQNPVIRGFNPDPTICVVHGKATTDYYLSTSTFEYFPGCAIYHSTDLVNWDLIGHALTRRSQVEMRTVEPGAGSWASTLRYREDEKRFYLATGVFQRYRPAADERIFPRGFYIWTDNIWDSDSWSDPIYFDNPGFDQDLFWNETTSKVYLSTTTRLKDRPPGSKQKDFGIHVSEIDLATGRTLTAPTVIRRSPYGLAEGSHLFRRGAFYYLLTAEGGTEAGHQEWIFRSRADRGGGGGVFGPWEDRGQALWYNGPTEEVQRTGHVDMFEDGDGEWWAVFLGVRPVRVQDHKDQGPQGPGTEEFLEPQMGRETFLVKVDWVDDWPVVNEGRNITLETRGRGQVIQALEQVKSGDVKWRADLEREDLELGWYQKNTPLKKCYSLTERPGHLRLYGNCYDLSWPEAPAMLLRKQSSYTETFHAKLQFRPDQTGYEAGVVLWWSQYSYASIGIALVQLQNGQRVRTVVCCQPTTLTTTTGEQQPGVLHRSAPLIEDHLDGGSTEAAEVSEVPDTAELKIEARPREYRLSLQSGGHNSKPLEFSVPAVALTTMPPVGGAFCGTMFGIYSIGKGEPVLVPADFSGIFVREGDGRA